MNRKCSTGRLFLKISQYSQENTFLIKNAGLQALQALSEHWEIFKNIYFEVHLRTAASESLTWTFSYMNK